MHRYGSNALYGYAWKVAVKMRQVNDVAFVRSAYAEPTNTDTIRADLKRYEDELKKFSELRERIDSYQEFIKHDYDSHILGPTAWFPLLYFLIRVKKPEIVVETGCATGTTSSLILYALTQNNRGHLWTIDVRFSSDWITGAGLQTGFLVPDSLKSRWTLILQNAKSALPELLTQLGRVDFFYHDSDHRYVHQMWEYLTAWSYIPNRGVLASDDITHNTAYFDFGRQIPDRAYVSQRGYNNFGAIFKSAHSEKILGEGVAE